MAWGLGGGFEKWSAVTPLSKQLFTTSKATMSVQKKGFISITKHITDSSHKEVTASSDF